MTLGIRYCAIFIKNVESFGDELVVQYETGGPKEIVPGIYLFTDKNLALQWVEDRKQRELNDLNAQIIDLKSKIDAVNYNYAQVTIEDEKPIT